MSADEALQVKLDFLGTLHPKVIDLGLERVYRLLNALDNPHLKLPPVIHVAGTNGKGSSVATLKAILQAHGKTCHVMTSPHLVRFHERFVIQDTEISSVHLLDLLEEVEHANKSEPITFFEIITVVGLLAFSRSYADYTILETGMGGRLDATNVIPNPALTLITMISYDHQSYLGHTLTDIAKEKAGIMKLDTPCIIGKQTPEAKAQNIPELFVQYGDSLNSSLYRAEHEWSIQKQSDKLLFTFAGTTEKFPLPVLLGDYQLDNTGNAIMAAKLIINSSPDLIAKGIQQTSWPGRLQKMQGSDIYIDGGHNDSASEALARQAQQWYNQDGLKLHLVLGMLSTKDPSCFIKPLLPYLESITCVSIPDEQLSFDAQSLLDKILPHVTCPVQTALLDKEMLYQLAHQRRVLVTGSLYLAGWMLKNW